MLFIKNIMVISINHHASAVIVIQGNKILLSCYDEGHPHFPFMINAIGGNALAIYDQTSSETERKPDTSPRETLRRELFEEFRILQRTNEEGEGVTEGLVAHSRRKFAPQELIFSLRDQIIQGVNSSKDYFGFAGKRRTRKKENLWYLESFNCAIIDKKLFEEVEKRIDAGEQFVNEGLLKIIRIEDLIKGSIKPAWGIGRIIGHNLGFDVPEHYDLGAIPCPWENTLESYKAYKSMGILYRNDPESVIIKD